MKKQLYTIKDTITGEMLMPFAEINDASTLRAAKIMANAKKPNYLTENMKDKQIWKLGTFNVLTGEITSKVEFLTNVIDLKFKETETMEELLGIEKETENGNEN